MLKIRRTRNLDLIARLDLRCFGEDEAEGEPDPASLWWVATVEGRVAGYCGMEVATEEGARYGYLCKAGVLPQFRGKGLQRALIKVRDSEAKRLGLVNTLTYTSRDNLASANNLIRCGYTLYEPHYKFGLKTGLYFWKQCK